MSGEKRRYYEIAARQTTLWLEQCAADPSAYMRPIHVAIIRLILRKRRGEQS